MVNITFWLTLLCLLTLLCWLTLLVGWHYFVGWCYIFVDITFCLTILFGWHYFLVDITFWLTLHFVWRYFWVKLGWSWVGLSQNCVWLKILTHVHWSSNMKWYFRLKWNNPQRTTRMECNLGNLGKNLAPLIPRNNIPLHPLILVFCHPHLYLGNMVQFLVVGSDWWSIQNLLQHPPLCYYHPSTLRKI